MTRVLKKHVCFCVGTCQLVCRTDVNSLEHQRHDALTTKLLTDIFINFFLLFSSENFNYDSTSQPDNAVKRSLRRGRKKRKSTRKKEKK